MIFTTLVFLVYLVLALGIFWSLPNDRWRHPFLFVANFVFYGWWDWRFLALLLLVIVVSYGVARRVASARSDTAAKKWVAIGCVLMVGILGYFKYTGFFMDAVQRALESLGTSPGWTTLNIILPVGISFYIFQAISYVVSVYRKKIPVEKDFIKLGVYLAFFPHLVAGPIIHAAYFLPQLASKREYKPALFFEGCRKFVIGFIYKAVFADNLAAVVDPVYQDPSAASNLSLLAGSLGFYGQIYFDFAGYSLMAIGVANMFGYLLPDNFNHPYRAASLVDFWHRWHISLSTWLRDYVYIPLGGNRGSFLFRYRNLFLTMLIGGFWHGASWNFILWGAVHGLALCINHAWRTTRGERPVGPVGWAGAFLLTQLTVFLCWIPFRAESFADTLVILNGLLQLCLGVVGSAPGVPWLLLIVPLLADSILVGHRKAGQEWALRWNPLSYVLLMLGFLIALLFMHVGYVAFIYFQF